MTDSSRRDQLLAPRADLEALAAEFSQRGRVTVPGLLHQDVADQLRDALQRWPTWALVTRIGGQHRNFDATAMLQIDADKRARLDEWIADEAKLGFQYLYERCPLYDPDLAFNHGVPVLEDLQAFLQGGPFIELVRTLMDEPRIEFADGQLTRYRSGHFLTEHDDVAEGKHRIAAYVLSMTPDWRLDYGGQLQFIAQDGGIEEVVVPGFNRLSLFRVPQLHQVTAVAPYVRAYRYSITGWLRHR